MKTGLIGVAVATICISAAHAAPAVSGNQAVVVEPSGKVKYLLPPPALNKKGKPPSPSTFHVSEGTDSKGRVTFSPVVFMLETDHGLQECMRPWYETTGCRGSTYGTKLAKRYWVVKQGDAWLRCPAPAIAKCAPQLDVDATAPALH